MWHSLVASDVTVLEKVVRTLVVYLFLLVALRLAGKRELGQLNPFDLVVLLLLSNTLQNAIIGNDNSLSGGIIGAAVLLALNWLFVRFLYDHPMLDRWVEGRTDCLIHGGKVLHKRLRSELITVEELAAAARRQGFESLKDVQTCRLEVGGALTFVGKQPTADDKRHVELLRRIDVLTRKVDALQNGTATPSE